MPDKIIDGEAFAKAANAATAAQAAALKAAGRRPHLLAVQVGENPASRLYTNQQGRACASVGIQYQLLNLPESITQDKLLIKIEELNASRKVTGIILQMPLPGHLDARAVQVTIDPNKDVEGMHPQNMGRLFYGGGSIFPCTPMAAVALLRSVLPNMKGLEAVVVGHSEIVGKPIAAILLQSPAESPTVTVCHVATRDLAFHTRRADVLVVATGVSQARWLGYQRRQEAGQKVSPPDLSFLIKADMIKPGATVIDVAINRIPAGLDQAGQPLLDAKGDARMVTVGDVDFQAAKDVAGAITPVPGGVGPVTVAMLLANTVAAAKMI
jgi:methylenetetrahydrofolate dehydrogenase (NADP+)/methenyltetrahydrofolate cyclohydrolase